MKLYQFISDTVHPFETILVFDEAAHTLYDLNDFIDECYKKGIPYNKLSEGLVTNICVNGDFIQCEVDYEQ